MAPSVKQMAKKNTTFQLIAFVVSAGIILLIFFLTSQDDSKGHDNLYVFNRQIEEDDAGENQQQKEQHHEHNNEVHNDQADQRDQHHDAPPKVPHRSDDKHDDKHDAPPPPRPPPPRSNHETKSKKEFVFQMDKPRMPDEEAFYYQPKSKGGVLHWPPKTGNLTMLETDELLKKTAERLYKYFSLFDENETSVKAMPFHSTFCVGRDCPYIAEQIEFLGPVGLGCMIVVVSSNDARWPAFYEALEGYFPGRFAAFHRPEKLHCAEAWNTAIRLVMTLRLPEQPDFLFLANADWRPKVHGAYAEFCEYVRTQLHLFCTRYFDFTSFVYTRVGYRALGYFEENLRPSLAEDVEIHVRAVAHAKAFGAGSPGGNFGSFPGGREKSHHITRASVGGNLAGDSGPRLDEQYQRGARFMYILTKWNVMVPAHRDFAHSNPWPWPWNQAPLSMFHNESFVPDAAQRTCVVTGEGKKYHNSGRCMPDYSLLQTVMRPGFTLDYSVNSRMKDSTGDNFPGSYH